MSLILQNGPQKGPCREGPRQQARKTKKIFSAQGVSRQNSRFLGDGLGAVGVERETVVGGARRLARPAVHCHFLFFIDGPTLRIGDSNRRRSTINNPQLLFLIFGFIYIIPGKCYSST